MINFKPRKYLILDLKQVFAGEVTTHVIPPDMTSYHRN